MNGGDLNQQQQQQQQQQQHNQQQQQQMQYQQWVAMHQQQQYQQWMAMQYPSVAMQQHMMYNQHYMPYYQAQQQQQYQQKQGNSQIQGSSEDNKTIWIGDLQQWMDEAYLHKCFAPAGEVGSVKIIRNKQSGLSERYGFIEFSSHASAEKVLQSFNGNIMPDTEQPFRLNWASFGAGENRDRRPETGSDLSIFVGDLATDVTDALLHETFASKYPSVKGAKVVIDANSGRTKGYGFVRFGDENERSRAISEMNGAYCLSRPMRVGVATPKKPSLQQQQFSTQADTLAGGHANGLVLQGQSENDSSNTTVFVGGLDADVTEEELKQSFTQFGEVLSVKIPAGKGCGFVQLANRNSAGEAIERLNGAVIGKQTVRLSWGRNLGNKQSRGDWNGGYNGRQGGYNGYGYANGPSSNGHGNHQHTVSSS